MSVATGHDWGGGLRAGRWVLLIGTLAAAGGIIYGPALDAPFIFDDLTSIPGNPHIRGLWPIWQALGAPAGTTVSGRPVVSLSLALNYAICGLDARGYRLINLTIHLLSAALLFAIVRRSLSCPVFSRRSVGAGDGIVAPAGWLALSAALVWAVHPLQTECVTYIVQRTELLMGMFYLLTLYCCVRGWSDGSRWWFAVAVIACALGMASKEVMVTAPVVVLFYDRTFVSGSFAAALRRHGGLYAWLASTWTILVSLVLTGHRSETVGFQLGISGWDYLRTQMGVILWYLRLAFWPEPLCVSYHDWPLAENWRDVIAPAAVVLLLVAATAWLLYRRSAWGFLGAWFFLILAPSSSFIPITTEPAAERRMYLPLAAIVVASVMAAIVAPQRLSTGRFRREPGGRGRPSAVGVITSAAATIALGCLAYTRNQDYRSAVSIWEDAVAKRPGNATARMNLGNALYAAGDGAGAIRQYDEALRIKPEFAEAHYNLANALLADGNLAEAAKHYEEALEASADYAEAHCNLGIALAQLERHDEAAAHLGCALDLKPCYAEAHLNLGLTLARTGRQDEALAHFRRAVQCDPKLEAARMALADLLLDLDEFAEAAAEYRRVLASNRGHVTARFHLAITLATSGDAHGAARELRETLRYQPQHAAARRMLEELEPQPADSTGGGP